MYSYADGTVEGALRSLQGTYREMMRVRRDAENCLSMFDTLRAQVDGVSSGGGSSRPLLCLRGTIPVEYDRVYNFPVEITLPEAYPFKAPTFKVTPVGRLRIRPHHRNVDDTGLVYHPYIASWNPAASTIAELVLEVSSEFGKDPPLYEASEGSSSLAHSGSSSSLQRPPPPPPIRSSNGQGLPPPSYHSQVPPPSYQQSKPPPPPISSVPKPPVRPLAADLKQKVKNKLQAKYDSEFGKVQQDIQAELEISEKLEANGAEIQERLKTLKSAESELNAHKELVLARMEKVSQSIAERQSLAEEMQNHLDDYVQPSDAMSRQLMQCVAESLAIDDVLYHLNAALHRQRIDLKTFLKKARDLSREQFLKQALAMKIYQEQTMPEVTAPSQGDMRAKPAGKGTAFSSPVHYPAPTGYSPPPRYPNFTG